MITCPSDIEFLIHCYVSPGRHDRINAPAIKDTVKRFIDSGLIVPTDKEDIYTATSLGAAHVRQLCNVPLPVKAWIDQNGNVIGE